MKEYEFHALQEQVSHLEHELRNLRHELEPFRASKYQHDYEIASLRAELIGIRACLTDVVSHLSKAPDIAVVAVFGPGTPAMIRQLKDAL